MDRESLKAAAEAAGFSCTEREIRDLVRERLLRVVRREGRGRKTVIHHDADLLRLLVILALKRPPPDGFEVNRYTRLREWIGAVEAEPDADSKTRSYANNGFFPDAALPVLAYVLGVPTVPAAECRNAFLQYLDHRTPRVSGDLLEQMEDTFLPAMPFILLGFQVYQRTDIYDIVDARPVVQRELIDGVWTEVIREGGSTLRDEIAAFVPPALQTGLNAESLAEFARMVAPARILESVRNAPEDQLAAAALAARVLFGPFLPLSPRPFAASLIYVWAFFVSLLTHFPPAKAMIQQLQQMPEEMARGLSGPLSALAQFVVRRRELAEAREPAPSLPEG